jgi:hypothetical protein
MNSNWAEMNGYFDENKIRSSIGFEFENAIEKAIQSLIEKKEKQGITVNHFEIMKGLYRNMRTMYSKYKYEENEDIDLKDIATKMIYKPDILWWELP